MGWLRLGGSLKFQVSFAKEPYKRDDILQKTYNFEEPTNHSHPICVLAHVVVNDQQHEPRWWCTRHDKNGLGEFLSKWW